MDANPPLSPPAQAQSASPEPVPQTLNLVFPADGEAGEATRVCYSLTDNSLIVTYEVTTRDINPEKMGDTELYNGNVVELFICTTARPGLTPRPYYEFEVSPYNQELQVLIDRNGKFNEKWNTPNFKHSATIRPDRPGWDAMMEIPFKDLAWNGDPASIVGNAFAILGAKGMRRFYSAYLPPQQKPDFHEPSFFKPFPLRGLLFQAAVCMQRGKS
ncbi:MAG: hypothetical protein JOZ08_18305 [Verrucomicrobia bacterium]|nr:hypothetical protein [Verrucomicrobiota bacterium]